MAKTGGHWTVVSGGVLLALAWGGAVFGVPLAYRPIAETLPEILAVLVVLLAWRYRRNRMVIAAVLLAFAGNLVKGPLAGAETGSLGWSAFGLLLPVNLGLLALFGDRPVARLATLLPVVAVALQPWVVGLLLERAPVDETSRWAAAVETLRTPQVSLLVFLIAAVFSLLALLLRRDVFEIALLCTIADCAVVVHGGLGVTGATLVIAAAELTLLMALVEDGYRLAFYDQLTGLPGRRALDEALPALNGTYALAMVDVDHFKRFNDRYGHETGDQALRMVSHCLRAVTGGGRAYRYGGEEFVIVFDGLDAKEASDHLESLRKAISGRDFGIRAPHRPRKKPDKPASRKGTMVRAKVRVSIGLAGPTAKRTDPFDVLRAADRALYRAKRAGRNRLVRG